MAVVFLLPGKSTAPQKSLEESASAVPAPELENAPEKVSAGAVVYITDSGFEPQEVRIKKGESVTWISKSNRKSWPASDIHPTHTIYPESGGCIGSAFDACRGLEIGEEYNFQFNQAGTWQYHDHLRPLLIGTVVVE